MKRRNSLIGIATTAILALPLGYYAFSDGESIINPEDHETTVIVDSTTIKRSNTFLVLSDTHLHDEWSQAEIVSRGNEADTGYDLWDSSLAKFSEIISGKSKQPKPDYVILLGDLPWHAYPTDKINLASARKNTGTVLSELRIAAQKANVPLIYAPGNNDSWSGDYRAFTAPNGDTPFNLDAKGLTDWPVINSGTCAINGTQACIADKSRADLGCYAVYPLGEKGGIRLIILNSVMFKYAHHDSNHLHYYGKPGEQAKDIKDQMDWFVKQFTEGNTNDAIMIGMHIPPGHDGHGSHPAIWDTPIMYNNKTVKDAFLDIVGQHKDRIVGVLTSHTHLDGLRKMMYKDKNDSLQFSDLIVSIPAITPRNGNNPAFKQFTYDSIKHEWMNFTTIYHKYWPTGNVSKTWHVGTLSFNGILKGNTQTSLAKRIDTLGFSRLLHDVTKIYKAGGNTANPNDVSVTLIVKPDN